MADTIPDILDNCCSSKCENLATTSCINLIHNFCAKHAQNSSSKCNRCEHKIIKCKTKYNSKTNSFFGWNCACKYSHFSGNDHKCGHEDCDNRACKGCQNNKHFYCCKHFNGVFELCEVCNERISCKSCGEHSNKISHKLSYKLLECCNTCIKHCLDCGTAIQFRKDLYDKHYKLDKYNKNMRSLTFSYNFVGDCNNCLVCDLLFCDNCFVSICAFCGESAGTCKRCSEENFHVNFCETCCPSINVDALLGCTHYNCYKCCSCRNRCCKVLDLNPVLCKGCNKYLCHECRRSERVIQCDNCKSVYCGVCEDSDVITRCTSCDAVHCIECSTSSMACCEYAIKKFEFNILNKCLCGHFSPDDYYCYKCGAFWCIYCWSSHAGLGGCIICSKKCKGCYQFVKNPMKNKYPFCKYCIKDRNFNMDTEEPPCCYLCGDDNKLYRSSDLSLYNNDQRDMYDCNVCGSTICNKKSCCVINFLGNDKHNWRYCINCCFLCLYCGNNTIANTYCGTCEKMMCSDCVDNCQHVGIILPLPADMFDLILDIGENDELFSPIILYKLTLVSRSFRQHFLYKYLFGKEQTEQTESSSSSSS